MISCKRLVWGRRIVFLGKERRDHICSCTSFEQQQQIISLLVIPALAGVLAYRYHTALNNEEEAIKFSGFSSR